MYDKRYIIQCIRDYASEFYREPRLGLRRGNFEQRSYTKAVVEELIRAIRESDAPPLIVVEDFTKKMDDYASRKGQRTWMFSVAYDLAVSVEDFLMAMKS